MSRIYVLQAPELAVAAARMKADVNFLGTADAGTANWMTENHVFLRDVWERGSLTDKRLQRLYHRLFPGDLLFMDGTLPDPITVKASAYARGLGARVVIAIKADKTGVDKLIGDAADVLVCGHDVGWSGRPGATVRLKPGEHMEAWTGALALCLMYGLDLEHSLPFCRRAAAFAELPWYDEVAYERSLDKRCDN